MKQFVIKQKGVSTMMKKPGTVLLILALASLGLIATGCNDSSSAPAASTGTVSVMLDSSTPTKSATAVAKANGAQFNVTFGSLSLYNSQGTASADLFTSPQTIDLMTFTPAALLGDFPVPAGTYNCLEATIDSAEVVEGTNTCAVSMGMMPGFSGMCLGTDFLAVDENGSYEVFFDLPVVNASCPTDGGAPVFQMGSPGMHLR